MRTLLHLSASPRGALSHSRRVGQALANRLVAEGPMAVVRRDLAGEPPPPPDAGFADATQTPVCQRTDAQRAHLAYSERLIAELAGADAVLMDMPMHNFTVPATVKAWIDQVVRPGRTFRPSPEGKIGLLADRPVVLIYASAGPVGEAPPMQQDFLAPYMRYLLACIGLQDVQAIRLDALRRGPEAIAAAEARALPLLDRAVGRILGAPVNS